jgi:hypothetical protein
MILGHIILFVSFMFFSKLVWKKVCVYHDEVFEQIEKLEKSFEAVRRKISEKSK